MVVAKGRGREGNGEGMVVMVRRREPTRERRVTSRATVYKLSNNLNTNSFVFKLLLSHRPTPQWPRPTLDKILLDKIILFR